MRRRVRKELGLPISIGVARTKHLAKIASQVAKPDGLVVVDPATELDFLHDLPVELMWGVGPVTKSRLAEIGVHTIGQLAKIPGGSLEQGSRKIRSRPCCYRNALCPGANQSVVFVLPKSVAG